MKNNTATKLIPIVSDNKKIEVSINDNQAFIKLSDWVENLGWCGQKTLQIDVEMLDELHQAIAVARYKVNKQTFIEDRKSCGSKVLKFPNFV